MNKMFTAVAVAQQTIAATIEIARENARLAFEPGSGWQYSNTGFLLLGGIIEKVTGRSYFEHVRERVFRPAGMTATSSPGPGDDVTGLALAYAAPRASGGDTTVSALRKGTSAGGGVLTAGDLARFAEALRSGMLLAPEMLARVTSAKPELGSRRFGYGFSALNGDPAFTGHNGGIPGVFANLDIYPTAGYATVVLVTRVMAKCRGSTCRRCGRRCGR